MSLGRITFDTGRTVGCVVGALVGCAAVGVGRTVGCMVGALVGCMVGAIGAAVGAVVVAGAAVGAWPAVPVGMQAASASASSRIPPIELYLRLIVMIETPDIY